MTIYCIVCGTPHNNPKFCSRSCSAKHNNIGKRRHGKAPATCKVCGNICSTSKNVYCSPQCRGLDRRLSSDDIKARNREAQSKYRAKQYRVLSPDADKLKIKEIYLNCPRGYEVDHIVPLSLGGLHHENNLQYLSKEENRKKGNRFIG